jgi:hypothetical protein
MFKGYGTRLATHKYYDTTPPSESNSCPNREIVPRIHSDSTTQVVIRAFDFASVTVGPLTGVLSSALDHARVVSPGLEG